MRIVGRLAKWLGIVLGVLILLVLVLIGGVIAALNLPVGQREIVALANKYSGGAFRIEGLSGRVPTDLHIARVDLLDHDGAWATLTDIDLRLSLAPLLHRHVVIDDLHAASFAMVRLPPPSPTPTPEPVSSGPITVSIPPLPVTVSLRHLAVDRIAIAKAVTHTTDVAVGLTGSAEVTGRDQGQAHLALHDLDGTGTYTADAALAGNDLSAKVQMDEPAHGMISRVAALPDLGALHLALDLKGPQNHAAANLAITAGALRAGARGIIDLPGEAADLTIDAHAPAMKPAPGISWQTVDVALKTSGPFTKPTATGHVLLDGLAAQGVTLRALTADLQGDLGAVSLTASLAGLAAPGLPPTLLGDTPIAITAAATLNAPDRPIHLTVRHPLLSLTVDAKTKPDTAADIVLDLPNLEPLAAMGQQSVQGSAHITAHVARPADGSATSAQLTADVHLTQAQAQAMALTGGQARLTMDVRATNTNVTLNSLTLHGADIDLTAKGLRETATQRFAADWTLALKRLADVAPQVTGAIAMTGHAAGLPKTFALATDVTGTVGATKGGKAVAELSGPIALHVDATGLPTAPQAKILLTGKPAGSPADIAVEVARAADGAITATIDRLSWKSLSGQGKVALAAGATLPTGTVAIAIKQLGDFRFLIGQPLSGNLALDLKAPPNQAAHVTLQGRNLAFGANRLAAIDLAGDVRNPTSAPAIDAHIALRGIAAAGIQGGATVTARGTLDALALTLDAQLPSLQGAPANAQLRATLDTKAKRVALASLQAAWRGETLRLLAPARIAFGPTMGVDRLRLALGTATIDAAGEVSPRLNLHVAVANVTPALVQPFMPTLHAAGRIDAEAQLTGTTAAPIGTITLHGAGLRATTGAAASLPPASIDARARLSGRIATVDLRLDAGSASHVTVTGTAPISSSGPLNLQALGRLDVALVDPILEAAGRRATGILTLNLAVSGTATTPRVSGNVALDGGDFQDFTQGMRLSAINARIRAEGEQLIIESFTARAGQGTLAATGTIGITAPGIPLNITVTGRNAEPIESDLLTARLDTDIRVTGSVGSGIAARGTLHVLRADINIPDGLPPSVVVLKIHRRGEKPEVAPAPSLPIALDLTVVAPRAIFVRGHGLNAELGGQLHIGGTLANLQPQGHFDMIRGTFALVTNTLTFTKGEAGFDGGSISDPTIDFEATSVSNNVTATLAVTGYASAPKIVLSSSPTLPQDEVLSYILFHSSTSQLGPFQIASIAASLASLAGVNTGGGVSGLIGSVRQGLGLDQLSIGNNTGATGSTASTKSQSAPTLQAGRYVAPGIYVGAAQGTTGGGTAAQVQIDIAKGLKLNTQVGSDSNGVGVTYQFNY
ncbi:translocation/assembly module TamB domain-containing protein [Acidisoma cladoniae]|uniref:translocation/assembly module TamB domain-containing protein n=1 Tax=Acidisoma cladoniae TaxID=3040935 RepID=UPI00254C3702|nr:translocation/assembly module TamB domain-containing protein [Acidisoma sp. PAMC 29798]